MEGDGKGTVDALEKKAYESPELNELGDLAQLTGFDVSVLVP